MKTLSRLTAAILAMAGFLAFAVPAQAGSAPVYTGGDPGAAPVVKWNQLLQQTLGGPPFAQARVYAILHIAMADAAVAIEGRYEPYYVGVWASRGASTEAAVAQAAHDVLVALVPASTATFDAALQSTFASLPPWRRGLGAAVGRDVAAAVLSWRKTDGSATANPQPPLIAPSTLPGIWRQTVSGPAQFSDYINELPFGVLSPTQFLPAPPPQLESAQYAEDFDEVKTAGRATGATRTAEQTRFAQLFASAGPFVNATNPFRLWDNVARDVATAKNLSLLDTARLFALLSVSIHDGLQTAHASKYIYRLWRPETAIANADVDNNAATVAETGWAPLLTTPPYPSHSSNMTCVGISAARMLTDIFGGDAQSFSAQWYTGASPPVLVHSQPYQSFTALAWEEANSRVWGGIHFRFELDASEVACTQVAAFIYDNYMQPRRRR